MGMCHRVYPVPLSYKVNGDAVLILYPARSFVTHRCLAGSRARWCSLLLFLPGAGVTFCSPHLVDVYTYLLACMAGNVRSTGDVARRLQVQVAVRWIGQGNFVCAELHAVVLWNESTSWKI